MPCLPLLEHLGEEVFLMCVQLVLDMAECGHPFRAGAHRVDARLFCGRELELVGRVLRGGCQRELASRHPRATEAPSELRPIPGLRHLRLSSVWPKRLLLALLRPRRQHQHLQHRSPPSSDFLDQLRVLHQVPRLQLEAHFAQAQI